MEFLQICFSVCRSIHHPSMSPSIYLFVIFAWQAQYLVQLEDDSCCSAPCKWRFMWDADQSWDSFCVAGAVFGEVGLWLLLLRTIQRGYWYCGTAFVEVLLMTLEICCFVETDFNALRDRRLNLEKTMLLASTGMGSEVIVAERSLFHVIRVFPLFRKKNLVHVIRMTEFRSMSFTQAW